jgi:hypothetical protein
MSTFAEPRLEQQGTSAVAVYAQKALEAFQQCLDKAAAVHPRDASLVDDLIGRFSIWASNARAFAPGRDSLDHRLREASEVRDAVTAVLETLEYKIQACIDLLQIPPNHVLEDNPLSPIDDQLARVLQETSDQITLLHKFLNSIRRASKEAHNLKVASGFRIKDDDGNDVEDFVHQLFVNYVKDRFPGVSDKVCQRLAQGMLLRRKTILYRRKRFGQVTIRPPEIPKQPVVTQPSARLVVKHSPLTAEVITATTASPSSQAPQSVTQTATTLSPERFKKAAAPSVISNVKSVAPDIHNDVDFPRPPPTMIKARFFSIKSRLEKELEAELRSIRGHQNLADPERLLTLSPHFLLAQQYRQEAQIYSATAKHHEVLDQEWNKLQKSTDITCPFCFLVLPSEEFTDERKWRRHVKDDIDPYVCLFEDCDSPVELFSHSRAWVRHMEEHAKRWYCKSKAHNDDFVSNSRDGYCQHIKDAHPEKFTPSQIEVLANRASRLPSPIFEKTCPLCGAEEVNGTMEEHVIGHMQSLALRSLPTFEDALENAGESGMVLSSLATTRAARSTIEQGWKSDTHSIGSPDWETDSETSSNSEDSVKEDMPHSSNSPISKYASWGGLRGYLSKYPNGINLNDKELVGDSGSQDLFNIRSKRWLGGKTSKQDDSLGFIEPGLLTGIGIGDQRGFEWGHIIEMVGTHADNDYDPILRHFALKRYPPKQVKIRLDPDCAICHAPALVACDCEAKGLKIAIKQAEGKVMGPIYHRVRQWMREKSEREVWQDYHARLYEQSGGREQDDNTGDIEGNDSFNWSAIPPAISSPLWREGLQRLPGVLEYFAGLAELSLPADENPSVANPPLVARLPSKAEVAKGPEALPSGSSSSRTPHPGIFGRGWKANIGRTRPPRVPNRELVAKAPSVSSSSSDSPPKSDSSLKATGD